MKYIGKCSNFCQLSCGIYTKSPTDHQVNPEFSSVSDSDNRKKQEQSQMVKTCETCGDKGFSRYLTYSTGDTVEHMYSSELPPDELPAKMVMCGDEMTKFSGCHPLRISYLSLPDASAIPVAGPIWRGVFNTFGRLCKSWKGMEAFIPKTSHSEAVNIVHSMQPTLYLDLKKRSQLWPKNFDELGATDCNIGLYIFPQSARLWFKSVAFLWGAFKEKVSSEIPSKRVAKSRGTKSKQWTTLKKTKKAVSLVKYDRLPSLRPECKRARSKRGKKARKCNDQEADMFCQIFDKPGQAETCTDEPAVIASSGQENTSLLNDKIGTLENIVEECIPRVAVTIKEPKTVAVDESEKIVEIKTSGQGQALLPSLEVKQETPLEKGSCMTSGLDLERKSSSPSISSTVFMELDDEETTISGSQNCIEASVTTIPASNLEMAGGEYHESSSNRSVQHQL
ncbi:uncharacterized protein [Spinacia oleracea]|uniref:AIPP2-like SPOC-like domain-containing protein n=1 Tax=Spinacia oleracea TaxID=3562 RepID=A0ABM3RGM7_SPIOL|nr:uncharacterized protein LOC110799157 [Spinacia oleracea]